MTINGCNPTTTNNCQSLTSLFQMTSGGRLFVFINLPGGFDYQTGTVSDSDYSVEIYQFFLVPSLYNRISIDFYAWQYTTYPTYFTSFTQR